MILWVSHLYRPLGNLDRAIDIEMDLVRAGGRTLKLEALQLCRAAQKHAMTTARKVDYEANKFNQALATPLGPNPVEGLEQRLALSEACVMAQRCHCSSIDLAAKAIRGVLGLIRDPDKFQGDYRVQYTAIVDYFEMAKQSVFVNEN